MELKFKILEIQAHVRGKNYRINADGKIVSLVLTFHALERTQRWKLTDRQVILALLVPDEVLRGHRNRYIAHRKRGTHVLRAIYEYQDKIPVVITVYFPLAQRYFRGGGSYEDQILT